MKPPRSGRACFFLPGAGSFHDLVWKPAADVYRAVSGWLVKFDLAGVRLEDIEVKVSGRVLSVVGVRRDWLLEEGLHYHSLEIAYSPFERHIEFPADLESAAIDTEYQAGMLLVRIRPERTSHE